MWRLIIIRSDGFDDIYKILDYLGAKMKEKRCDDVIEIYKFTFEEVCG